MGFIHLKDFGDQDRGIKLVNTSTVTKNFVNPKVKFQDISQGWKCFKNKNFKNILR